MWSIPATALRNMDLHASNDQLIVDSAPLPMLRYKDQRADLCPVASHPNNASHPEVLRARLGGRWVQNADGGHDYELDFKQCKAGVMCISRGHDDTAGCDFVEVGEVKSIVSRADKKFKALRYLPIGNDADTHDEACLDCKWKKQRGEEVMHNYSQIVYFKKLNANGKLPKVVIATV